MPRRRLLPLLVAMLIALPGLARANSCELPAEATPAACRPQVCAVTTDHGATRYFVNQQVYRGWKLFRTYCHACHLEEVHESINLDETRGSPYFLVTQVRLKALSFDRFAKVVRDGRITDKGWMPAWQRNPLVAPSLRQIYAYLDVRANCGLPYVFDQRLAVFDERYLEATPP